MASRAGAGAVALVVRRAPGWHGTRRPRVGRSGAASSPWRPPSGGRRRARSPALRCGAPDTGARVRHRSGAARWEGVAAVRLRAPLESLQRGFSLPGPAKVRSCRPSRPAAGGPLPLSHPPRVLTVRPTSRKRPPTAAGRCQVPERL